jgi:hypothetical protein
MNFRLNTKCVFTTKMEQEERKIWQRKFKNRKQTSECIYSPHRQISNLTQSPALSILYVR